MTYSVGGSALLPIQPDPSLSAAANLLVSIHPVILSGESASLREADSQSNGSAHCR